jgi:hypothetical protein
VILLVLRFEQEMLMGFEDEMSTPAFFGLILVMIESEELNMLYA